MGWSINAREMRSFAAADLCVMIFLLFTESDAGMGAWLWPGCLAGAPGSSPG
jgi:hypothetical protein